MREKVTLVLIENKMNYIYYIAAIFAEVTRGVVSSVSASSVITSFLLKMHMVSAKNEII